MPREREATSVQIRNQSIHARGRGRNGIRQMRSTSKSPLVQIHNLRVNCAGDRRAPHKPLLLLYALGQLRRGRREIPFNDVKSALGPLLDAYAPPVKNRHQPELPFWHLVTDGLWRIHDADSLERQASGFPKMKALRGSIGQLNDHFAQQIERDPRLFSSVVISLLEEHFAPSTHHDILNAVGLEHSARQTVAEENVDYTPTRRRDPQFRAEVLRAYEHRCAFSGFQAALGGTYLGCEAAHVQWHSFAGPDDVTNGLALEPTIHKLFDIGAWSLTDDRRIIVSENFTGSDATVERIRGRHGKRLRSPLPGHQEVNPEFIKWHREPKLGGVFREPALPL